VENIEVEEGILLIHNKIGEEKPEFLGPISEMIPK